MSDELRPRIVRTRDRRRVAAMQTPGVLRELAFATDDVWIGIVITEPGEMSGWHHHGEHETYSYILSGSKRIEFGPGGTHSITAGPDEFIHLPGGLTHREGNPSSEVSRSIAFRVGRGSATVNVDEPL